MSGSAGSAIAGGTDGSEAAGATKTSVIISNLKRDVDKEALKALLCQLGRVTNFRLEQPPGIDPASPATGVVEYASAEDATRVVSHVHGKLILGRPVTAWLALPGSSGQPPPQGAPAPSTATSATTTAGPTRITYPNEMNRRTANPAHDTNGGRYPPAAGQMNKSHVQDPQWERAPPAPLPGQRVGERGPPPPQGDYVDGSSRNQWQQEQEQSWHSGRQMPQRQSGVNAAGAPRYRDEVDPTHYGERQWQDQGHGEADEAAPWEHSERSHYPPTQRAPVRREPPASYHRPPPPQSSGWYNDGDSRGAPGQSAYEGDVQLQGAPVRAMMPRGASGVSIGGPPRGSDDVYGDGDITSRVRRRPPPPSNASHGMPAGRAAGWVNDAEYTVAPSVSIKGADFEKEVVKAAALLVAEREIRAREEERKQGKQNWPGDERASGHEHEKQSKRSGNGKVRGRSRSAGEESDKRKKRESSSSKDDSRSEDRPKSKRTRRDSSPDDRYSSNGKRADERKGKPKTREESRGRKQTDDRDRQREDSNRSTQKEKGRDTRNRSGGRDKEIASSNASTSKLVPSSRDRDHNGDKGSSWEHRQPTSPDSGFYVHVGGLSFSTTFTTLAKRFAAFGDVNGFKVIFNKVSCSAEETSRRKGSKKEEVTKSAVVTASSGFAFISFDDERGMNKAVECMDGQKLDGQVLKVTRGGRLQGKPPSGVKAFRAHVESTPPSEGTQHRRAEYRGNHEDEQEYHTKTQVEQQVHRPKPRPEQEGYYTKPRPEQQEYYTKPRPEQEGYYTKPRPEQQEYYTKPRPEQQGYHVKPKTEHQGYYSKPKTEHQGYHSSNTKPERGDRRSTEQAGQVNEVGFGRGGSGGGTGGRHAADKDLGASLDPLGALRSPRPSATSRKETAASGKPAEANGRVKIGYGGSSRDTAGGNNKGNGESSSFRKVTRETSEDLRSSNTSNSGTRQIAARGLKTAAGRP